jgi:hypothetical protein
MSDLIPRNLQQIRRVAFEKYKNENNIVVSKKKDITVMKKYVNEKNINNYLSDEVAEEELTSTLTHYQMIKIKERVKDFISKVTQRTPNAFTLRTTAEFISDFVNEYNIEKGIKENKR